MGMIKIKKGLSGAMSKKFHPFTRLVSYLMDIEEFDNYNSNAERSNCPVLSTEDYRDRSCRELLMISFNFKDSPEGGNYWQKITNKVEANLDVERY